MYAQTADLLTTIEFDETGDYLATGDRGGRVVIFEKGDDIKQVGVCMFTIHVSLIWPLSPLLSTQLRVCVLAYVLQYIILISPSSSRILHIQIAPNGRHKYACKYRFYSEFQSHEPEFDYLKSLEIEEKINQIKWCKKTNGSHFLITANGKCVCVWRGREERLPGWQSSFWYAPSPHHQLRRPCLLTSSLLTHR